MLEERSLFTCGRNTINTQVPSDTVRRERAPATAARPRPGRGAGRSAPGVAVGGVRSGPRPESGPDRAGSAGGRSVGRPRAADRPCPWSLRSGRTQQDRPQVR